MFQFNFSKLNQLLFNQINGASLVFFRICFGLVMLLDCYLFLEGDKIERRLINEYQFKYWPFDFVQPLSESNMELLFWGIAILSIFIIIGFIYRISTIFFTFCYTYIFLLDGAYYLNHSYLICLIGFVLIFVPLNNQFSIDAKLFKKYRTSYFEGWHLWLLRFMIGLPYFFGGIAKLNHDWLHGYPMKIWLLEDVKFPFPAIQEFLGVDGLALFMSYSGLFLDLLIVPALLYKRTRAIGFITIFSFHFLNHSMFNIDIFPWFMIVATTLFFEPNWPVKLLSKIGLRLSHTKQKLSKNVEISPKQKIVMIALSCWIAIHIFLPLRHYFIPGNVHWTHEGQRFSWQMMLNTKLTRTAFLAIDKNTGQRFPIQPNDYLNSFQKIRMAERPHWVWRFCQIVKEDYAKRGLDVAVYAYVETSLNGRTYQPMIDKDVDLAAQPRNYFGKASWIIPLNTKLEDQITTE